MFVDQLAISEPIKVWIQCPKFVLANIGFMLHAITACTECPFSLLLDNLFNLLRNTVSNTVNMNVVNVLIFCQKPFKLREVNKNSHWGTVG